MKINALHNFMAIAAEGGIRKQTKKLSPLSFNIRVINKNKSLSIKNSILFHELLKTFLLLILKLINHSTRNQKLNSEEELWRQNLSENFEPNKLEPKFGSIP